MDRDGGNLLCGAIRGLVWWGLGWPLLHARTYNLYGGAAKVTLPNGAKLEPFDFGSSKGFQVVLSKNDFQSRVYIERKSVRSAVSDAQWRSWLIKYYNDLFKKYRGYKKNTLKGSGNQVTVDYQYKEGKTQSRDYTKYLRANKTTQVQAYYFTMNTKTWNQTKPKQMRAVVNSLRTGR